MANQNPSESEVCWFVGSFLDSKDQTTRFVRDGIWEASSRGKSSRLVKSIRAGERIAIKSSFTKKLGLPFDNRDLRVSVMRLKAIGVVTRNHQDGRSLDVDWTLLEQPKDWYFYTYLGAIWKIKPDKWINEALIKFAFEDQPQDIDAFRNLPGWKDSFGDQTYNPTSAGGSLLGENLHPNSLEELSDVEVEPYTIQAIMEDGCFIDAARIEKILDRLRTKKNLILQGPPGTGKSWVARRLGYLLIGKRDDHQLKAVQFHPNMSYEDFVRGWRPSSEGKLVLEDGPLLQMIKAAEDNPNDSYVMVIEEINRGNPAQIFGEMLTLLEVDKRSSDDALQLSYCQEEGERIFVPQNLHVIGTMNLADRSLAMLDFALRRRFAFVDLEPNFGDRWKAWLLERGVKKAALSTFMKKISRLNQTIEDDVGLGKTFKIGHSYLTPSISADVSDALEWFRSVVETEIGPLLQEYWFDTPKKAANEIEHLLKGI